MVKSIPALSRLLAVALLASASLAAAQAPDVPAVTRSEAGATGVELLLQADGAEFGRARAEWLAEAVRSEFRRVGIAISEVSASGDQLGFRVKDPARVGQALRTASAVGASEGGVGHWDASQLGSDRIVMRESAPSRAAAIAGVTDAARMVVDRRLSSLGAGEASVVRQGEDRILVRIAGVRDPEAVKLLILPTARVEFRLVDLMAAPEQIESGDAPVGSEILPFAGGEEGQGIAVSRRILVNGEMIVDSRQSFDEVGTPVVTITFSDIGARRFAMATRENVGKPFAIVIDNVVISAPNINEPILGGQARISGAFTVESAGRLAAQLNSGILPVRLKVVEERVLTP